MDNIVSPAPATPPTQIEEAPPLTVHLPVDARGVALSILAIVALIFALEWAQPFLITVMLGILFAYTLNPLVVFLERIKIPRVVGAAMVMMVMIGMLIFSAYALQGQVQIIVEQLPEAASKLSAGINKMRSGSLSNMQKMQAAANTLEKAANQATLSPLPKQRATHERYLSHCCSGAGYGEYGACCWGFRSS